LAQSSPVLFSFAPKDLLLFFSILNPPETDGLFFAISCTISQLCEIPRRSAHSAPFSVSYVQMLLPVRVAST
jgi:hypothetical protein